METAEYTRLKKLTEEGDVASAKALFDEARRRDDHAAVLAAVPLFATDAAHWDAIVYALDHTEPDALEAAVDALDVALAVNSVPGRLQVLPAAWEEAFYAGKNPPTFRLVKHITLSSWNAEDAGLCAAKNTQLTQVETLDFRRGSVETEGAIALASATHLANLKKLDLNRCAIEAEGAVAIIQATHFAKLEHLDLYHARCEDRGARALGNATHLTRLQYLDVGDNGISGSGAEAIADAKHLASLRYLHIHFNSIGDAGVLAFERARHLNMLQVLNLENNSLDDSWSRQRLDRAPQFRNTRVDIEEWDAYDGTGYE